MATAGAVELSEVRAMHLKEGNVGPLFLNYTHKKNNSVKPSKRVFDWVTSNYSLNEKFI